VQSEDICVNPVTSAGCTGLNVGVNADLELVLSFVI